MFAKFTQSVTSLVSSVTASFPYKFEADGPHIGVWRLHAATRREDGSAATLWRVEAPSRDDPALQVARGAVHRAKTLRHPALVAFRESGEAEERGMGGHIHVVWMATEPVQPLLAALGSLSLAGLELEEYAAMGLRSVFAASGFLVGDCRMVHGAVSAGAVFVTPEWDWKLGLMDAATEQQARGDPGAPLRHGDRTAPPVCRAPEVARGDWAAVAEAPPHAVDAWGLGCLIQEVFSGARLSSPESLRSTPHIPTSLLPTYQRLLSSHPTSRLHPSEALAQCPFLKSQTAEIVAFLEQIAIRDDAEKARFFETLPAMLEANVIPSPVRHGKLLRLIGEALEKHGAPPQALGVVLKIGERLSPADFLAKVLPVVTRLFASTDRNLRRELLERMPSFGPLLPNDVAQAKVFPAILSGFQDQAPYIRELTLKSMVVLAPKIEARTLSSQLLKHLAALQSDPEPGIRANTAILLGNIAKHLGPDTCRKVLLDAFSKSLRDPFPPSRSASLRALAATLEYYSPGELAQRVMPAAASAAIDADRGVRDAALAAARAALAALEANARTMDAATAPEEKVGPVGPAQPGGRVPEPMPMLGAASAGSAGGQAGGAAGSGQVGPRPGQATGALDSAGAPLSQHIGALGLGPGAAGRSPLAAAAGPASRESDEGGRRREASGIAPKAPIPTPASQGARKGPAGKDLHASLVGEADDEAWGSFGDFGDGSGWGSVTAAGPGARGSRGVLGVAQGQAAGAQFGPNGVGAANGGRGASQPLRLGGEPQRGAPGLPQQRARGPLSLGQKGQRTSAAVPGDLLSM